MFDKYKETLFTFFKLQPILDLSLKYNSGTSYPVITDDDILNLPFPLIPNKTQTEIANQMQRALECRAQSKTLLEIAKRCVEIAIEKNEPVAVNWMKVELSKLKIDLKEL